MRDYTPHVNSSEFLVVNVKVVVVTVIGEQDMTVVMTYQVTIATV